MYSLTRVWIGPKEARIEIIVRSVVRSTNTSEIPSTPTLYWIPKKLIQSACCTNWKPACSLSKARASSSETRNARPEISNAALRIALTLLEGMKASTNAPMRGVKMRMLRMSSCPMSIISGPSAGTGWR